MMQTASDYKINLKYVFDKVRFGLHCLFIVFTVLSIVYLFYSFALYMDDTFLGNYKYAMNPLAMFLCPYASESEIYKLTGFTLVLLNLPLLLVRYFVDKTEELLLEIHNVRLERNRKQIANELFLESLRQYDVIQAYSICLSVDYESKRAVPNEVKQKLNKKLFKSLEGVLTSSVKNISIHNGKTFIVKSHNFEQYDTVYDTVLKVLAKIKTLYENKIDLKLIPSITTDAYITEQSFETIEKDHFNIQTFNFKNRACATAMFSKKYKFLKHNKYAGIPIGEYVTFDKKSDTYELNIVHKNLNNELIRLA